MKKYLFALILLSAIDIGYTSIGAFYGGGGAELNPLFSWATDPTLFIAVVICSKIIAMAVLFVILHKLWQSDIIWAKRCGTYAIAVYSAMLLWCLVLNVQYCFFR